MRDEPTIAELIDAVAAFLREQAIPQLGARAAFDARVAANVLDIVRREIENGPRADAAERERLERLLGARGDLPELNRLLCERIARGEVGLATPGLADHLWQTAIDKVAIDQPGFSTFRDALARDG